MAPDFQDIVPYHCVFIDAEWSDFFAAVTHALLGSADRATVSRAVEKLWLNEKNPNRPLLCLSVRSALDLFLQVKNFPPGSEVIMSAINIPDMVAVVRHHGLKVVPLDINLETCAPKAELLQHLLTERTVAMLVAHIYGKRFDLEPFVKFAKKHGIVVIEDCAEAFGGFDHLGHPEADINLFSFGAIKFSTAFGGAVAKVGDQEVHRRMVELQTSYPQQSTSDFLLRVFKYSFAFLLLNHPFATYTLVPTAHALGIDHKKHVVQLLRGFRSNLVKRIRHQPSDALLSMMKRRMTSFHASEMTMTVVKGDYVTERLTEKATHVGTKAPHKGYWLYPVIVESPDEVLKALNALGVDAYRGATQLSLIEPEDSDSMRPLETFITHYPHEAKFLIDHVVYLPVNKTVPFQELDRVLRALEVATKATNGKRLVPLAKSRLPSIKVTSKL